MILLKQKIYLAAARSERGKLMVVATNQLPRHAITIYLRRWEIECLFQALKGRGFCFEETRLIKPQRICRLMALPALGFAWAHTLGEMIANVKPMVLNQYQQQLRPQFSYFRYGLDSIRDTLFQAIYCTLSLK